MSNNYSQTSIRRSKRHKTITTTYKNDNENENTTVPATVPIKLQSLQHRLKSRIKLVKQSRKKLVKKTHKQSNLLKLKTENTSKKKETANNIDNKADLFYRMIIDNTYVDTCMSKQSKCENSFYSLVERELSHSDAIKLGIAIEKIFCDLILTNPDITNIREKNIKGVKEKDHLFYNEKLNTIYYAEVKSNLTLDTEKRPATIEKMKKIIEELKIKFGSDKIIKAFLFAPRYFENDIIPDEFKKAYEKITLIGVNNYLKEFNVNYSFKDEKHYKRMINYLENRMFLCYNKEQITKILKDSQTGIGDDLTLNDDSKSKRHISRIFNKYPYPSSPPSPITDFLRSSVTQPTLNNTNKSLKMKIDFEKYTL